MAIMRDEGRDVLLGEDDRELAGALGDDGGALPAPVSDEMFEPVVDKGISAVGGLDVDETGAGRLGQAIEDVTMFTDSELSRGVHKFGLWVARAWKAARMRGALVPAQDPDVREAMAQHERYMEELRNRGYMAGIPSAKTGVA